MRRRSHVHPSMTALGVRPARLRARDAGRESLLTVTRRPARALLTALGTILGVGTLVATLGIAGTASHEVSSKFNALAATQVVVSDNGAGHIPETAGAALRRLHGVTAAGVTWPVDRQADVSTIQAANTGIASQQLPVLAVTPGAFAAMGAVVSSGRTFDTGIEARGDAVAVLGEAAARTLGVTRLDERPAVFLDGVPFTVVGVVSQLDRDPAALLSVMVPFSAAHLITADATPQSEQVLISTAPGAAQVVGAEAVFAVNPAAPKQLSVLVPPDPSSLRHQVEEAASSLLILLAGLSMIIGVVAIANTTLLAVLERTPEIGLRRAIGARPRHIGVLVMADASILGFIGGAVGTTLGLLVTASTALAEHWVAVLNPWLVLLAPAAGVVIGFLAGGYPAWRATRIEPIAALQRT